MRKITNEVIANFKNYMVGEEKALLTIEKYIRDVKRFANKYGKSVQNIENGEEVIANVNEKTLTSEKWIDIGYRPSDTIEYYFFEGETYKSRLLNGAEFETGVYKIENDKVMLLDSGIEFEYIDDGVFKIINGKRMIRQDEV